MFELSCKIKIIGKKTWVFEKIVSCELSLDSEQLLDTCRVEIPNKIKWSDETKLPIRKGDKIEVYLGYSDKLDLRFIGYITKIGTKAPIVIEAEDTMFLLKKAAVKKKAYKTVDLKQLLSDIIPSEVSFEVLGGQSIGAFRITEESAIEVLSTLAKNGIKSFFKIREGKPILYCGVIHNATTKSKYRFNDKVNTANIITNETEYSTKEDVKLGIKATSILSDNKRIEIEIGDKDGDTRTIFTYNKTKSELETWAKQELERLKYEGLRGSIEVFGSAPIDKIDIVELDMQGVEKGKYLVKKVSVKFGSSGYRQTLELERKII